METMTMKDIWEFRTVDGFERKSALWLYPELDCSSCVQDCEDSDDQFGFYCDYIRENEHYREWWDADAVPVCWSVYGDGICEFAPYKDTHMPSQANDNVGINRTVQTLLQVMDRIGDMTGEISRPRLASRST
jgi:hypothetical protein